MYIYIYIGDSGAVAGAGDGQGWAADEPQACDRGVSSATEVAQSSGGVGDREGAADEPQAIWIDRSIDRSIDR